MPRAAEAKALMGKGSLALLFSVGLLAHLPVAGAPAPGALTRQAPPASVPKGLRCLWHAYPEDICQVRDNALIWCDGETMTYDTKRLYPDHDARLNHADLEDMMAMPYPTGDESFAPPALNVEPGRVRHEPFFRKLYGDTKRAVAQQVTHVRWLNGRRLKVTTRYDVHERLKAVREAIRRLAADAQVRVQKSAGAFNWRHISGTKRLSMHSFAIAIDVGVPYADYWKWSDKRNAQGERIYRNRIPRSVVEAFEAEGFIWGGKWYHFDTMHFEYRPELLHPLCRG